ncbi:uncharacterized protein METZ01_LOCUS240109 [marine metagenome]|uniref:Uncharacterized protein n=1 Tax=marine metagenome TaxID=408172 RepID=A0A382HJL5_9ZZZZ
MGTSSGATCSWPGCDQPPTWGQIESGVWTRLCAVHLHPDLERHRLSLDPTTSEASSAPTPDKGETGSDSDRLTARERASAEESQRTVTGGIATCSWPTCARQRLNVIEGQPWCGVHGHPGFANFRQDPTSLESPTSLERELFVNSAVSYNFWTDSIEDEDREQLRLAVSEMEKVAARKRRWGIGATVAALAAVALLIVTFQHGLQDVGMHTGDKYTQVFGLFLLTLFVGAFSLGNFGRWRTLARSLKPPVSPRLQANSEERFNAWLEDLETTDPDHHAEIVEWFRQVEWARQEEARIERERQARLRARSASQEWPSVGGGLYDPNVGWVRGERANAIRAERANAWTSYLNPTQESYPQQQEQARQAAYQPSQNASRSEPTCVFCDRPGMHQTASGLMCGIHLHHLM